MNKKSGYFRIVGGRWRGKKFAIPATTPARPSLDRVRETLFNWLQMDISGRHCLDAFAGTGALGIEALSRGAASCHFCEIDPLQAKHIQQQLASLTDVETKIIQADFFQQAWQAPYDLVFLDPPFNKQLLLPALEKCQPLLADNAIIYAEIEKPYPLADALANSGWEIYKRSQAGQVAFYLLRRT